MLTQHESGEAVVDVVSAVPAQEGEEGAVVGDVRQLGGRARTGPALSTLATPQVAGEGEGAGAIL